MIKALKSRIKSLLGSNGPNVEPGDRLPVFRLQTQDGKKIRSEEIECAVLYFYPKAGTRGCTNEAKAFRDRMSEFESRDVTAYGVSTDSKERLKEFKKKQSLNFDLLSDKDREVSRKMGVLTKGGFAERSTFVLENGIIREIFRDVSPEEHAEQALQYFSS